MNTINLKITKDEAKMGCTKLVYPPESDRPVTICIPPKAVDGQMYRLSLAAEEASGLPDSLFVRISVIKQRRAVDTLSIISALVLIVSALLIIAGRSGNLFGKIEKIRTDIKALSENARQSVTDVTKDMQHIDVEVSADVDSSELTSDIVPHYADRYFVSGMNEDCRLDFFALYRSAMDFEETCVLPRGIDSETLFSMLTAMQYECPELIQLDYASSISYKYNQADMMVTSVDLKYNLTQDEYKKQYGKCCAVIDGLKKIAAGADEETKEKIVYDYLVSTISYDMDAEFAYSAYGALVEHKAKCDGISLAFKWVLEELGMECICLRGDPVEGSLGHAWNMVKINGSFYSVDVTSDIQSEEEKREPLYVSYNVSNDWITQYYTVSGGLDSFREIPVCRTMNKSFHVLNGTFICSGQDASELFYSQLDSAKANGGYVIMQFEDVNDRNSFVNNIEQYYEKWARSNGGPACTYSYTEMYNMLYLRLE